MKGMGIFLYAFAESDFLVDSTIIDKCLAARVGHIKTLSYGVIDVVLEGDCSVVIDSLMNNIALSQWSIKCIIHDCKNIVGRFGNIFNSWSRREINKPAHMLANRAFSSNFREE